MSFLQRLKERGVDNTESLFLSTVGGVLGEVPQLNVDIYQAENLIVIYAQVAGSDMSNISIAIEGDADIVIIEGLRQRPEHIAIPAHTSDDSCHTKECHWGDFYRRIILPMSVEIDKATAQIENGVLILCLPLIKSVDNDHRHLKISRVVGKKSMS